MDNIIKVDFKAKKKLNKPQKAPFVYPSKPIDHRSNLQKALDKQREGKRQKEKETGYVEMVIDREDTWLFHKNPTDWS